MTPPIIPEQDMLVKKVARAIALELSGGKSDNPNGAEIRIAEVAIEAQASLLNEKDAEIEALKHDRDLRGWGDAVDAHFDKGRTASLLNMMGEALGRNRQWFAGYVANGGKGADEELALTAEALATLKSHVGEKVRG